MTDKQYIILDEILAEQYTRGYEEADSNQRENAVYEYERGLNEAWEIVRKIMDMNPSELGELMGADTAFESDIINKYSASEAIAKVKEYEEKQKQADDEIKVGDEVTLGFTKGIVTRIGIKDHSVDILWRDGSTGEWNKDNFDREVRKTKRHFPQIDEILKQMKMKENEE